MLTRLIFNVGCVYAAEAETRGSFVRSTRWEMRDMSEEYFLSLIILSIWLLLLPPQSVANWWFKLAQIDVMKVQRTLPACWIKSLFLFSRLWTKWRRACRMWLRTHLDASAGRTFFSWGSETFEVATDNLWKHEGRRKTSKFLLIRVWMNGFN